MTNAAALRIILDYLQSPEDRDQELAIAAAERLWLSLETEGHVDFASVGAQVWNESAMQVGTTPKISITAQIA